MLKSLRLVLTLLLALCFWAPAGAQAPGGEPPVRVFAASSLTDALNALGEAYQAAGHPRPIFNYAASSALARQIDQGASADLYISADEPWMDYLARRHLIDAATRVRLLSNRLVLIAPRNRPIALRIRPGFPLHAALHGGRLAMADPDSVPAGRYGRTALLSLGVWHSVEGDVVRAENVRAALRYVEIGEAAAGVVYLTDARASTRVVTVDSFPVQSYPTISYPMAVVQGGRTAEAKALADFLQSDTADALFVARGFILQ